MARAPVKPGNHVIAWEKTQVRNVCRKAWAKQYDYGAYLAGLGPATGRDGAPRKSRTLTCLLGAVEAEEAAGLTARCFPLDVDGVVSLAGEAARRGRQISGGTLSPIPRAS